MMKDLTDHLKHRLNFNTIASEFVKTMEERVQPQGADELANALFTSSGYLPWPNQGQELIEPMPERQPEAPEALHSDGMGGFYNSLAPSQELALDPVIGDGSSNSYLAGYEPPPFIPPEFTPGQSSSAPAIGPIDRGQSDSLQAYLNGYSGHSANHDQGIDH